MLTNSGQWPGHSIGAREASGGLRYYRLLRRAADVVTGPRTRERAVGGLQAVLGAGKYRRRGLGAREATRGPLYYRLLRRASDVVDTIFGS